MELALCLLALMIGAVLILLVLAVLWWAVTSLLTTWGFTLDARVATTIQVLGVLVVLFVLLLVLRAMYMGDGCHALIPLKR
jgi:hypothetical protein